MPYSIGGFHGLALTFFTSLLVLFHGLAFRFDGQAREFTCRRKTTGSHQSKQKNKSAQSTSPTFSQHFSTQMSPHYVQLDPIYYGFLQQTCSNPNDIYFFSNPVSSSEKMAQLESMLKKRSGINLPSRHQILLNLKQELSNLYDSDPKLLQNGNIDNINKRLEFTKDKITILNILEGEETDSRFKGKLVVFSW
jgi:hypothetical protein